MSIPDVWVEVSIGALKHNLQAVKKLVGSDVRILAVVKGNGFGHGYVEPARAFVQAGADYLAVTRLEEALELRSAGIDAPILVFAPVLPKNLPDAISAGLDITVTGPVSLQLADDCAKQIGVSASIHIKVDTGMGRLGTTPVEAIRLLVDADASPNINVSGLYTHLADAGARSPNSARNQLKAFTELVTEARERGLPTGLVHACNSAGLTRFPEYRFDMVRPGTVLYGQHPSSHVRKTMRLSSTWALKARICDVRDMKRGASVGYGMECVLKRDTKTAVIPVGFADGFTMAPEGPLYRMNPIVLAIKRARRKPYVTILGKRAEVLGRVAMQMIVVDVTHIPGVGVGDEVTVPAMRIPVGAQIERLYVE